MQKVAKLVRWCVRLVFVVSVPVVLAPVFLFLWAFNHPDAAEMWEAIKTAAKSLRRLT